MGIGKILRLGGIDNSAPKTDQSVGRFRVARNVMPTPDGTLIPRYDYTIPNTQATNVREYMHITEYDGESLELISQNPTAGSVGDMALYKSGVRVPMWVPSPDVNNATSNRSQLPVSYRVNNTTYFHTPEAQGVLMKYDGVEFGPAGCPSLNFYINSTSLGGATYKYLRTVVHTIDFDNNEPVSQIYQFRLDSTVANSEFFINGQNPAGFTFGPAVATPNITPSFFNSTLFPTYNSFEGTALFDSVNDEFVITTTASTITTENVGAYVFVQGYASEMAKYGVSWDSTNTILGVALKIKSVSGGLKLDQKDAYLIDSTRQWVKRDLTDTEAAAMDNGIRYGTRYYVSFWDCPTEEGVYYYRGMSPIYIGANTALANPQRFVLAVTASGIADTGFDKTMFTIEAALQDWYDTDSLKIDLNSSFQFGANSSDKFYSMTKFQDLLLVANQDVIWYSDPTAGGWIEQFNQLRTLLIGDKEYGRITAICGTSDFLFVSRERKNYYVTGNLVTGNYRIQEVSEVDVGAWCNNSAIKIKDSVMFITSAGIYQMVEGGRCVPVSTRAPKNFDNFSANNANEDVVFRLTGTNSALVSTNAYNDFGLSVAYDAYRDLLVWMRRTTGNPSIVVHTKSGELYEWEGIAWGFNNMDANCLALIRGNYYFGTVDKAVSPTSALAFLGNEDKTVNRGYCTDFPSKLYTTWITAGEPSLEKELLQLKMFGRIDSRSVAALKVKHYKDWDISTPVTDSTYISQVTTGINNQIQYSHKKRLNSDKCLAASVGIETVPNMDFEIESFEVEFNTIQVGMKR